MRLGEIKELVEKMMTTFTPLYVKEFGVAMITSEKEKRKTAEVIPYHLFSMPVPSDPIKVGFMEKLGEVRKNWKKRFFVLMNQADNYEARYFETEQEAPYDRKAVKGTGLIQFAYRSIHRLSPTSDEAEFKELSKPTTAHILKVAPYWSWDQRRTWYFEVETAEEAEEWERALRIAAWRANPPLNPDPVKRAAFEAAYRRTRWELGVWSWYMSCATEEEMLAFLANEAVEDTIMPAVYSSIRSGRAERIIRNKVRETVNSTVGASVRAGWVAASKGIDSAEPTIRDAVSKSLGPILDAVVSVETKVADTCSAAVKPVVEKTVAPALEPVLRLLFSPLAGAHAKAIDVMRERFEFLCAIEATEVPKYIAEYENLARYQWGYFWEPCRVLREDRDGWGDAARSELAARAPGLSEWRMDQMMREGLLRVMKNAIYTFKVLTTTGIAGKGPMSLKEASSDVLARMAVDCKTAALQDMEAIFLSVLFPLAQKAAKPAVDPLIGPIDSAVPEVAKAVINPAGMVDDLLYSIIQAAVRGGITAPAKKVLNDRMAGLKGLDAAAVSAYEAMPEGAATQAPVVKKEEAKPAASAAAGSAEEKTEAKAEAKTEEATASE